MKNNKFNTILLVLLNLSLITGFSYILFTGGLEKAFKSNSKFLPVSVDIATISKLAPTGDQFGHQSLVANSKRRSSDGTAQADNNVNLPTTKLESFYVARKSRGYDASEGLSSGSGSSSLLGTEELLSRTSQGANTALYAGTIKGGSAASDGNTYASNIPFTDGISTFPRSSVPRIGGAGTTILIDPMTDPIEDNRIPVGEGFALMLLFAAAFAGKVYRANK